MTIIVQQGTDPNRRGFAETGLEGVQTVGQALARLALTRESGFVILLNGKVSHWNAELQDGDLVQLVPAAGGG